MQTLNGKAPCSCLHSQYMLVPTATLVMWGTFPLTATDTLIPEVGLLLAPWGQSHLKKLPSPLALGSEGTSKPDPKTHGRVPARLPGLWLAGFPGSRKSPFTCCFLKRTPATLMSSAGLFGCGQGPERPSTHPRPAVLQCPVSAK